MIFYEKERFGNDRAFVALAGDDFNYPPHFHRSFEFVYVFDGEITVQCGDRYESLPPGRCMLIFPNRIHSYRTRRASKIRIAIFSPEFVDRFYEKYRGRVPEEPAFTLGGAADAFVREHLDSGSGEFMVRACLYMLCAELERQSGFVPAAESGNDLLTHKLLTLIERDFREKTSLSDAAKELGYNYQYLSKFFNRRFGCSFPKMVNLYRVEYAARLLRTGDEKITDIAYLCGFENLRSFNRSFYEINGCTPKELRAKQGGS